MAPAPAASEHVGEEPGRLVAEPLQAADREHVVQRHVVAVPVTPSTTTRLRTALRGCARIALTSSRLSSSGGMAPTSAALEHVGEEPGRLVAEPLQAADGEHVVEDQFAAVLHVGEERVGALLREVLVEHPAHELLVQLE